MKKIMFNDRFLLTKAVLEGRKTQTRRIITAPRRFRGQDVNGYYVYRNPKGEIVEICMKDYDDFSIDEGQILPKYKLGEVVAVAQSYQTIYNEFGLETMDMLVTNLKTQKGWTNKMNVKSAHMPHQILITGIRVERLQDISEEDCLKEGVYPYYYGDADEKKYYEIPPDGYSFDGIDCHYPTPVEAYAELIDKISGKGTWESNPYVFVYDFELVK